MRTLVQHLTNYASYHRDRRNIATHFVGIPMIVLGILSFLARPSVVGAGGISLSPALLLLTFGVSFYLCLDLRFGLTMLAVLLPAFAFGGWLGAQSTNHWLIGSSVLFVLGWAIQFVGHIYEGKKPAFVDDLVGLLIGPLFLVAEIAFAIGLRGELLETIEGSAGPTHSGRQVSAVRAG